MADETSGPLCAMGGLLGHQCPKTRELAAAVGGFLSEADIWSQQVQKPIRSLHAMGWAMEEDCTSYPSIKPGSLRLLSHLLLLQTAHRKSEIELGKDCRSLGVTFSAPDKINIQEKENKSFLQHKEDIVSLKMEG